MPPSAGIDTAHIKDTALKDLLDLLEGVRERIAVLSAVEADRSSTGARKEGSVSRQDAEWAH